MNKYKKQAIRAAITVAGLTASAAVFAGRPDTMQVPEPGTLGLFALGIAGIAIARKLRK